MFFIGLVTMLSGVVHAAEADPATLQQIQQRLDLTHPIMKSSFTQTRKLVGVKRELTEEGALIVDRKVGVVWETFRPFAKTVRITQNEIRQKSGDQLLSTMTADQEPVVGVVSKVLFSAFSGDLAALVKYFRVELDTLTPEHWQVTFVPRETGLAQVIHSLTLAGDSVVRRVTLTNASGDRSTIHFSDTTFAETLSTDDARRFE